MPIQPSPTQASDPRVEDFMRGHVMLAWQFASEVALSRDILVEINGSHERANVRIAVRPLRHLLALLGGEAIMLGLEPAREIRKPNTALSAEANLTSQINELASIGAAVAIQSPEMAGGLVNLEEATRVLGGVKEYFEMSNPIASSGFSPELWAEGCLTDFLIRSEYLRARKAELFGL